MTGTFYLAGGYSGREALQRLARRIEVETGAECTARWLDGRHDDGTSIDAARDDFLDVRRGDTLVVAHGPSTRGVKWVELGLALAWNKPVVLLIELRSGRRYGPRPPVFAWMDQVARYQIRADGDRAGDVDMSPRWPGRIEFLCGVSRAFHAHLMPEEAAE